MHACYDVSKTSTKRQATTCSMQSRLGASCRSTLMHKYRRGLEDKRPPWNSVERPADRNLLMKIRRLHLEVDQIIRISTLGKCGTGLRPGCMANSGQRQGSRTSQSPGLEHSRDLWRVVAQLRERFVDRSLGEGVVTILALQVPSYPHIF